MTPRRKFLLFLVSVTVVCCATAYRGFLELFSGTAYYDDTGYMLSLIRGFNEHGHLYGLTFSQYGPFVSEFYYLVCRCFGVPATHDGIRWVVLCLWTLSSVAGAILALRVSGRIWIAIIAQLLCFDVLSRLSTEPGHPIGLVVPCLSAIALCLAGKQSNEPTLWQPVIVGVLLGILLMIKINLGVFAWAAVATAAVFCAPLDAFGKTLRWIASLLFCLQVVLLTAWPTDLRLRFVLLFLCCLISVLLCIRDETCDWRTFGRFLLSVSAASLITCTVALLGALLTGSNSTDLIDGIIRNPMRLGSIFTVLPPIGSQAVTNGVVGLTLALAWRFFPARFTTFRSQAAFALRFAFLIVVIVWFAARLDYFTWVLPFLWIALLPINQDRYDAGKPIGQFGRASLVLLAVGQFLGLYPVSGSQMSVPVYLGALSVLLVVSDILVDLRESASNRFSVRRIFAITSTSGLAIVLFGILCQAIHFRADAYKHLTSLNLPGAKLLRLDEFSNATYRFLAENLGDCHPSFVTVPGVNSLYGWSRKNPPTGFNATMNFALLSNEQQRAIVNVGRECQPIAAVFNQQLVRFWANDKIQPSGPLIDFVTRECRSIGRVGDYELMILREAPPPVLTYYAILNREWETEAPDNQVTVSLPKNFGNIRNLFLLRFSSRNTIRHPFEAVMMSNDLETVANTSSKEARRFSLYIHASKPLSPDLLDETLIQLQDESNRVVNLPFLRPPDR